MECHQNDDAMVIGYRPQSVANVVSVGVVSTSSLSINTEFILHLHVMRDMFLFPV